MRYDCKRGNAYHTPICGSGEAIVTLMRIFLFLDLMTSIANPPVSARLVIEAQQGCEHNHLHYN